MTAPDLNSDLEINKRLLKAFSVESLKAVFNLTGSKERQPGLITGITKSHNSKIINDTVFKNFSLLKQYVYLYEVKGVLNDQWLDNHPAFLSKQKINNSHLIFNLLVPVKYEGYNKTQGKTVEFEFLVPVQIHKKKTVLIIHINILERDIATITTDKIYSSNRDINDEKILEGIIPYANPAILFKLDLNKGIKKLWDIDDIDAIKINYKKAKSTSLEVMDENAGGIKKEMPLLYAQIIKTPLRQATFRVLKHKHLMNFFIVNPSAGTFQISVFPQHLNGINDLIDLVLTNN
jgi:hypothetical protein